MYGRVKYKALQYPCKYTIFPLFLKEVITVFALSSPVTPVALRGMAEICQRNSIYNLH
jgi:hypothetical protein